VASITSSIFAAIDEAANKSNSSKQFLNKPDLFSDVSLNSLTTKNGDCEVQVKEAKKYDLDQSNGRNSRMGFRFNWPKPNIKLEPLELHNNKNGKAFY